MSCAALRIRPKGHAACCRPMREGQTGRCDTRSQWKSLLRSAVFGPAPSLPLCSGYEARHWGRPSCRAWGSADCTQVFFPDPSCHRRRIASLVGRRADQDIPLCVRLCRTGEGILRIRKHKRQEAAAENDPRKLFPHASDLPNTQQCRIIESRWAAPVDFPQMPTDRRPAPWSHAMRTSGRKASFVHGRTPALCAGVRFILYLYANVPALFTAGGAGR